MGIVAAGVILGLSTAVLQSLSYIFSRRFLSKKRTGPGSLFCLSHIHMGIISAMLLPFFLRSLPGADSILPLAGTAGFYLTGQFVLFRALNRIESSQLTPLLGFKIPILGMLSLIFFHTAIHPLGWVSILLCTAGGIIMSPPRGSVNVLLLASALIISAGYAGSDICIPILIKSLSGISIVPVAAAVCLCYIVCGIVGLVFLLSGVMGPRNAIRDRSLHVLALPYSAAWLAAMVCLFACFNTIGVVFGNMLQSTRAILSVLIGILVTRLGFLALEDLRSKRIITYRFVGASVITAAIMLFVRSRTL
ncbi:MAG: hypothetical protein AABZ39_15450 [Spirochaetota bacterium]